MRSAERTRLPVRQRAAQSSEASVLGWQRPVGMCQAPGEGALPLAGDYGRESKVVLRHEELALLLGGIDLADTQRRQWYRREVTPVIDRQITPRLVPDKLLEPLQWPA